MPLVDPNNQPTTADNEKAMYTVPLEEFNEKSKFLCSCGLSNKLPFCDGTHAKGTPMKPVEVKIQGDHVLIRPKKELMILQQKREAEEQGKKISAYVRWGAFALVALPIVVSLFSKKEQSDVMPLIVPS